MKVSPIKLVLREEDGGCMFSHFKAISRAPFDEIPCHNQGFSYLSSPANSWNENEKSNPNLHHERRAYLPLQYQWLYVCCTSFVANYLINGQLCNLPNLTEDEQENVRIFRRKVHSKIILAESPGGFSFLNHVEWNVCCM